MLHRSYVDFRINAGQKTFITYIGRTPQRCTVDIFCLGIDKKFKSSMWQSQTLNDHAHLTVTPFPVNLYSPKGEFNPEQEDYQYILRKIGVRKKEHKLQVKS